MIRFLIGYLRQQPDWFRMSIPDLIWFLDAPEDRIRQLIADERLPTAPKTEYLPGLVVKDPDIAPYYVYKHQIIHLVRGLRIRSVDHPADFQSRMDKVRAYGPKYDVSWKFHAVHRH